MEMFCEYLPDSIREVAAGAAGQKYMWWLATDCKMLTAGNKTKAVWDSFSFYTRLSHIFQTMPNQKNSVYLSRYATKYTKSSNLYES